MSKYVFFNNAVVLLSEARVSPLDIGMLRGFGIYEAMITRQGVPFMWDNHADRFFNSAQFLSLTIPLSREALKKATFDVIAKNKKKNVELHVKYVLTGGEAQEGIHVTAGASTFYIFTEDHHALGESVYGEGAHIGVYEHLRHFPQYKTTEYIMAVLARNEQKKNGEIETLYTWQGSALECSTSNFFIVRAGVIYTQANNILHGITRDIVIGCAERLGYTVVQTNMQMDEVWQADETFLTASFKGIVPVVSVGDKKIKNGKVGEVTRVLMKAYEKIQ